MLVKLSVVCLRRLPRIVGIRQYAVKKDAGPGDPQYMPKTTYVPKYHEPEYLKLLKPAIPFYELVNFQVTHLYILR